MIQNESPMFDMQTQKQTPLVSESYYSYDFQEQISFSRINPPLDPDFLILQSWRAVSTVFYPDDWHSKSKKFKTV